MNDATAAVVERVAHKTYHRDMQGEDWEMSLAIDGLISTGESEFVEAARNLIDRQIELQGSEGKLGYDDPKPWLDDGARAQSESSALVNGCLEFYERTGEERYLDAARKQVEFLLEDATRLEDGTISFASEPIELWVDSIYLVALPLARYGDVTDDEAALEEAIDHVVAQEKLLQDPYEDLFRHEWRETPNTYPESTFWLRGNGWAAAGILNMLEYVPDDHENYDTLVDSFQRVCAAMLDLQDASGFWHHIPDDPWTAKEASGTLQFAYTFHKGVEQGLLGADEGYVEAAERAFEVCKGVIDDEGAVTRVAVPPGGPDVPLEVASYGQGWFLLAAEQLHG
ncbi:glycoside hydrolase family 88 protein [Natrinema gelatinilyticum]|uniref:glycoside hydrolase family 88 protein n=1 Tax=Natrinema gelatinilyticum TaxID=2961571 RepID=UPI0020C38FC5|nr:glycoside hydrolase family 88 protein [Natrinema gelatinilyticum]